MKWQLLHHTDEKNGEVNKRGPKGAGVERVRKEVSERKLTNKPAFEQAPTGKVWQ